MSAEEDSCPNVFSADLPAGLMKDDGKVMTASCMKLEMVAGKTRERTGKPPETHSQHRLYDRVEILAGRPPDGGEPDRRKSDAERDSEGWRRRCRSSFLVDGTNNSGKIPVNAFQQIASYRVACVNTRHGDSLALSSKEVSEFTDRSIRWVAVFRHGIVPGNDLRAGNAICAGSNCDRRCDAQLRCLVVSRGNLRR